MEPYWSDTVQTMIYVVSVKHLFGCVLDPTVSFLVNEGNHFLLNCFLGPIFLLIAFVCSAEARSCQSG